MSPLSQPSQLQPISATTTQATPFATVAADTSRHPAARHNHLDHRVWPPLTLSLSLSRVPYHLSVLAAARVRGAPVCLGGRALYGLRITVEFLNL